jgi:hypothetical protein
VDAEVKEQIRAEIASQPESPIYSVFLGRIKSGHAEPKRLKGRSRERTQKEGHPPILNRWPCVGVVCGNLLRLPSVAVFDDLDGLKLFDAKGFLLYTLDYSDLGGCHRQRVLVVVVAKEEFAKVLRG